MKQVLQSLNDGNIMVTDVPTPNIPRGHLLISSHLSLISPGTEKMLLDFGKSNLLGKAQKQPEKVKMVLNKVKTDGLWETVDAVKSKLNAPISLGYSNVGVVVQLGDDVDGFSVGDRVLSNGPHAELVTAPKNLCVKIPDEVGDSQAVFGVLGSIALQSIRLLKPTLGETFAVFGVGVVGLLAVQILLANGCKVLAFDYDSNRLKIAKNFGADTLDLSDSDGLNPFVDNMTNGLGIDGAIIATATQSNDPIDAASKLCRKRGRIILVGTSGLQLNRDLLYEKEITFQVSCSYGPGRYDYQYEILGHDYPPAFVRWTEQRNFLAILGMLKSNSIKVENLISHEFAFFDAKLAYETLLSDKNSLGILLKYASYRPNNNSNRIELNSSIVADKKTSIAMVGAGNYATKILIPNLRKTNALLHTLVSFEGKNSAFYGKKANFKYASTDLDNIVKSDEVSTLIIATPHSSHASLVIESLKNSKNVFVEKPLCINLDELAKIKNAYKKASALKAPALCVGFNRREAPLLKKMKTLISKFTQPKSIIITVNAGKITSDHWISQTDLSGGRLIGEACHFIDLARFLTDSKIDLNKIVVNKLGSANGNGNENFSINLRFEDGSIANIIYTSEGAKSFPKERVEVFTGGAVLQIDNFRILRGFGINGFRQKKSWKQDKGQGKFISQFIKNLELGKPLIPVNEIFEVTEATLIANSLLAK